MNDRQQRKEKRKEKKNTAPNVATQNNTATNKRNGNKTGQKATNIGKNKGNKTTNASSTPIKSSSTEETGRLVTKHKHNRYINPYHKHPYPSIIPSTAHKPQTTPPIHAREPRSFGDRPDQTRPEKGAFTGAAAVFLSNETRGHHRSVVQLQGNECVIRGSCGVRDMPTRVILGRDD